MSDSKVRTKIISWNTARTRAEVVFKYPAGHSITRHMRLHPNTYEAHLGVLEAKDGTRLEA